MKFANISTVVTTKVKMRVCSFIIKFLNVWCVLGESCVLGLKKMFLAPEKPLRFCGVGQRRTEQQEG